VRSVAGGAVCERACDPKQHDHEIFADITLLKGGGSIVASKEKLIIRDIQARAVFVPLGRPVATKVGEFAEWPLILIDLHTEQGITGRGYLAPYIKQSAAYIVPALHDIAKIMKGEEVAPVQTYRKARASLGLVGYHGISTIAVAGFDMACWDALAKATGVPLVTLLGGTIGPVKAYNSNGLGLMPPDRVAEEALERLKRP
jgi:mandelate racemase